MMGLLEQQVARIEKAYAGKEGVRSYDNLEASPPSYRFEDPEAARVMLDELDRLADAWAEGPQALSRGAPRPAPELRILPRV